MLHQLTASALLFDLDGTLINSLPAVERAWKAFALRHGLDPTTIFEKIHGRRSIDSIRLLLPDLDAESEDQFIRNAEATDTRGVVALPGTIEFLTALPQDRWAIVTSGTSDVALARCRAAGLPEPGAYVFGEDVTQGKPEPEPFLLAAAKLGEPPAAFIGFEDTVAGLTSIAKAGMRAISIRLPSEFVVEDLRQIKLKITTEFLVLEITT